jgi:oxygen-independent coproporphyrinogen-3 oxidase
MGYTVMPASDQVGIGVTSIGDIAGAYAANQKNLARYQQAVNAGHLPIERGIVRSPEDELRGAVIHRLICTLHLELDWVESTYDIDARTYFADAFSELETMAADGLVEIDDTGLHVTPLGRFFLRNLCMPFDTYLKQPAERPVYSRTV